MDYLFCRCSSCPCFFFFLIAGCLVPKVPLLQILFSLYGLTVTMLLLEERFLSSTMQGMELAGWKMSRSQQEGGGREGGRDEGRELGGFTSLGSVHTHHQNAGSESCSSPVDTVINCTAFWFNIICYWFKIHFCFIWICLDFSEICIQDWLVALSFSSHGWEC